jgi:o-succinylbenzoate---CoA ligase
VPEPDESPLVLISLPPPEATEAVRRAWDRGDAVAVIDPKSPRARVTALIDAIRPTHLLDASGTGSVEWGEPVSRDVAAVVTTSGTTAEPRLVALTRDAMAASARAVSAVLETDSTEDRWLVCVPLHFVAGLAIVARSYFCDVPATVHETFDIEALRTAAPRCTLVSVVPTMLTRLLDAEAPLQLFRRILVGGGPVSPALLQRARVAGANVATTYGLSETGGGCVHDGEPLDGVAILLSGDGEILVKGPVVMRGYHHDEAATWEAFTSDGWLRTGDLGLIDGGGLLQVTDRLKDIVITGGVKVSPTAVERVLVAHRAVDDLCVVGLPDDEWGEQVVAFVVPGPGTTPPTLEELRLFGSGQLTPPELPRRIVYVDAIPRSASGKALRRQLRAT